MIEHLSINPELQLFRIVSGTYLKDAIGVLIIKGRAPFFYMNKIRETLSNKFTDVFIVDSSPIEICKISRANRSAICLTTEIRLSFGYWAAQMTRHFGYKGIKR